MEASQFRHLSQGEWDAAQAEDFLFTLPCDVQWGAMDTQVGWPWHQGASHSARATISGASPQAAARRCALPPACGLTHLLPCRLPWTQMLRRYWAAFPAERGAAPAQTAERILIFQRGAEVAHMQGSYFMLKINLLIRCACRDVPPCPRLSKQPGLWWQPGARLPALPTQLPVPTPRLQHVDPAAALPPVPVHFEEGVRNHLHPPGCAPACAVRGPSLHRAPCHFCARPCCPQLKVAQELDVPKGLATTEGPASIKEDPVAKVRAALTSVVHMVARIRAIQALHRCG